jgi:hypothetical protein
MKLFLDSVGGGAWPFVVGGAICLVHSDNERDSGLLTSALLGDLLPRTRVLLRGTGGAHEAARSRSNNRSVMPFDGLGRTRATLKEATRSLLCGGQARSSVRSRSERTGQPLNLLWLSWPFVVGTGA